jgi:hypothetical protein
MLVRQRKAQDTRTLQGPYAYLMAAEIIRLKEADIRPPEMAHRCRTHFAI